jgi:flagellar hook assembly protein FlgD
MIYNLLGQRIKTLVNSFQSAGSHSVVWDGTDEGYHPVSSGIYFYSLSADKISFREKMVLAR